MKETTLSVPTGTFPASEGDTVRVSLKNINGLEMLDAVVMDVVTGCGVVDRVVLRYDETMLPFGVNSLNACRVSGFQKQCDCCSARMCYEVFSPSEDVLVSDRHVMILPGDFRLDRVKFYSPNPQTLPLKVNVIVGESELFPHDLTMDGDVLTVNRPAFASEFSSGYVPHGTSIQVSVEDAPEGMYYEDPWKGLTVCLIGIWYPHTRTEAGSLRRIPGIRPSLPSDDDGDYPEGWVDVGDGTWVSDGDGNFVLEQ